MSHIRECGVVGMIVYDQFRQRILSLITWNGKGKLRDILSSTIGKMIFVCITGTTGQMNHIYMVRNVFKFLYFWVNSQKC